MIFFLPFFYRNLEPFSDYFFFFLVGVGLLGFCSGNGSDWLSIAERAIFNVDLPFV